MMHPGAVEVVAYQETLLIMAVFGIAALTMVWVGFRRWLQHKDTTSRAIAEHMAEFAAHYGAQMERVEARLEAIEKRVNQGSSKTAELNDCAGARVGAMIE